MADIVLPEFYDEYQSFLDTYPHTYVTQALAWSKVKPNWQTIRFAQRDSEGAIVGVAQMLTITDATTGKGLAYIPRGPVTTPNCNATNNNNVAAHIFPDVEIAKELVKAAYEYCQAHQIDTLRLDPQWYDNTENREKLLDLAHVCPGGQADLSDKRLKGQPKYSMILDLRPFSSYDEWFAALKRKHRYYIRQAQQAPFTTYISHNRDLISDLHLLIRETAKRQGISYRPESYFYDLYDAFESTCFSVVEYEGSKVSIALNVLQGDTMHNLYAGNKLLGENFNNPVAMNACFIAEAFERGLSFVDFGGVFGKHHSDGLYVFKRHFMPADQDITTYTGEIDFTIGR